MRSIPARKLSRARPMRRPGVAPTSSRGLVEHAVHMKGLEIPAALDRDFLIDLVADFRLTFAQLDRRHALDRVARRQVEYRPLDCVGDCRRRAPGPSGRRAARACSGRRRRPGSRARRAPRPAGRRRAGRAARGPGPTRPSRRWRRPRTGSCSRRSRPRPPISATTDGRMVVTMKMLTACSPTPPASTKERAAFAPASRSRHPGCATMATVNPTLPARLLR